ncbi:SGNH hydrolase-type esterase domain-containing protein [Umbelopsis sp. PMI_123]|nr:SGNH hydrolase-type esterase domain-containing protein [Umbelopsis sp. PMI_123]
MNILYDQIVLFGDSLTQGSFETKYTGWAASLADAYQRRADVLNRGFSGYTSRWALPIFKQLLPETLDESQRAKIRLMTVFFGANDASEPWGTQHVPIDEYADNLSKIVQGIQNYSSETRVIVIAPPPLNEVQWKARCEEGGGVLDRSNERAKAYSEAAKDVARKHNVPYIDLWTEIMKLVTDSGSADEPTDFTGDKEHNRDLSEFLYDGLHLGAAGCQVLFAALMQTIKLNFPELNPETMSMELPEFWEVPKENYEEVLVFRK